MICTRTYSDIPLPFDEICRYAGCPVPDDRETAEIRACLAETAGKLSWRVCYTEIPLSWEALPPDSLSLEKYLKDCAHLIVFAATVGLEPDRRIARYSRISPVKALFFQAIGAAAIESLCDHFCAELAGEYTPAVLKPRFSPGYGDVPLTLQKDIFTLLDCPRKIGLTLNESMLMSPTKSVTALIGIRNDI